MSFPNTMGRLERIDSVFKKLRDIFQCQICFAMKNEEHTVFFGTCHHVYCLDCIKMNEHCSICESPNTKANPSYPIKLKDNENILAIYRLLLNYPGAQEKNKYSDCVATSKLKKNKKEQVTSNCLNSDSALEIKRVSTFIQSDNTSEVQGTSTSGNTPQMNKKTDKNNSQKKKSCMLFKRNHKGETPLHLACRRMDFTHIKELINAGADPNVKDNAGWTPLHDSIEYGNKDIIKFLLDSGAMVNVPGYKNMTALHQAVIQSNPEIVELLVTHGAKTSARDLFGSTPLDYATGSTNAEEVRNIMLNVKPKFECPDRTPNCDISEDDTLILCDFDLNETERPVFDTFTKRFKCTVIDKITPLSDVTHAIISRSMHIKLGWKFVGGVLKGCQVVFISWLEDCISEDRLLPIEKHKVRDPFFIGFYRSQFIRANFLPGIFSGCHFYLGGNFDMYKMKNASFSKKEVKAWIEKCDGIVLSRNPNPESLALERTCPFHLEDSSSLISTSYYIIYSKDNWDPVPKYNMSHIKTLPFEWLMVSMMQGQLIEPNLIHIMDNNPYLD